MLFYRNREERDSQSGLIWKENRYENQLGGEECGSTTNYSS